MHSRLERLVRNLLAESSWIPSPVSPAGRVKMTLKPDPGVDPEWFDRHYRASWSDVRSLSDQDLLQALEFAGSRPSGNRSADERLLFNLLKPTNKPKQASRPSRRLAWSDLSPKEQQYAIDDVIASYGEAGKRVSRQLAAKMAKSLYSRV